MLCHLCSRAEEPGAQTEREPSEVSGVACRYLDLTLELTSAGFLQQPSLSPSELDELEALYLKWFSFFTRLPPVAFLLAATLSSINANRGVDARMLSTGVLKTESHHCVPGSHTWCPVYSGY